jgi:hypothetical protein
MRRQVNRIRFKSSPVVFNRPPDAKSSSGNYLPQPTPYAAAIEKMSRRGGVWGRSWLIVDGLVAFKGSANVTNTGLRKADRGLDLSEIVTDYAQVTTLNNKYFAPVWRRITAPYDVFSPYADLPF